MNCPKCQSNNTQVIPMTFGRVKGRSGGMIIIHLILALCTFGLWLIVPILSGGSKGTIKTININKCLDCGKEWD